MRLGVCLAVAAVLLSACAASVNPVLQTKLNNAFAGSSSEIYNAKGTFSKAMPFAVGQYTVIGVTQGKDRSVVRTAIVGKEGSAWVMETDTYNPANESIMQMAVNGLERAQETMNSDELSLVWIKVKSGEEVQTYDGTMLSMMQGFYKKAINGMFVSVGSTTGSGSVKVPAGTFNGCTKANSKVEGMFGSYETEGFYHPSVPLSGLVHAVSVDDGSTIELLDFGLKGAAKSF